MSQESNLEADKPTEPTEFLPSDGASCSLLERLEVMLTEIKKLEDVARGTWKHEVYMGIMRAKVSLAHAIHHEKIRAEYRKALAVIESIEERYIDGCDTYEDWKFMGDTAREYLSNDKMEQPPLTKKDETDSTLDPKTTLAGEVDSGGCAPMSGSGSATVRDLERHNAAWVKHFVKPVARFMQERGISEVRIKIGKDGKASYLLEPDAEWIGDSIHNAEPIRSDD